MIYTDINADAGWAATEFSDGEPPWLDPPAFATIDGFDLRMVQVDWMHTWSLGVAQDVLGSAIKLMCKGKRFYAGSNIPKRISQFYRDLKIYAAANGKTLSCKRLRKHTLRWENGCPELHVKAADIAVILPFVRAKLEEFPLEGPCTGLLAMVWAADELSGSVMASKTFLTMDQQRHIRTVGDVFLSSYCLLAQEARDRGEYSKISPFDPHGERRSTEQKISGMGQLLYGGGPRATLHSHSSQSKSSDGRENFASSKFCAGEADHAAVLAVNGRVRSRLFAWARKRRSALAE